MKKEIRNEPEYPEVKFIQREAGWTAGPGNVPWLDIRLEENIMNYLWDIIGGSTRQNTEKHIPHTSINPNQPPNTPPQNKHTNSIHDKDNWFYETVLKQQSADVYYGEGSNYYDVHVAKSKPPPKFTPGMMWVNHQKQYEFMPAHCHAGLFSFVVFMKIPTHSEEQHALAFSVNSPGPVASDFQFLIPASREMVKVVNIPLSPEDEGRMLFFPAWLTHQVYPFYGTEEDRITIAGNIL